MQHFNLHKGGVKMAADAVKIMKGMMAALESQDFEKAATFFADDCKNEDVTVGKVCHGVKEYIDMAKLVRREFPDRSWKLKSAFSDGNKIASETVWSGTFTHSDDPKRPATGKHTNIRCVSITEIRNGKIYRNRDYYDGLSFAKQLGLLPETPSE
jgi:steroid delta-isomerase-like uncharacterized protein